METDYLETTFLIIGGGIAGVSCAENLSYLQPNEKILLLTETYLIKAVTNLVPLGKMITKFNVEERESKPGGINDKVDILQDTLEWIDSTKKQIQTKTGKLIKYKFLCICTGARPKLIKKSNPYIIGIRDTESVLEFQQKVKSSRRIVIVGNGGIASEIAYELENIEVHWVIKDNHISSTFVDPGAAQFFQKQLFNKDLKDKKGIIKRMRYEDEIVSDSKKGAALGPDWHRKIDISGNIMNLPTTVKIHYNSEIKEINEHSNKDFPLDIVLSNDEIISCDFLVSATGVDPKIGFKIDNQVDFGPDGGIKVNEMMETNVKDVYAAGDVCCASWEHGEHWFQMRLWTQARQMGAMAGRSMAAKFSNETVYQDFCFELFTHATNLFGYQVVLLGRYNGQGLGKDYEILLRYTPDVEYIKFVLKDGRLKGVILIGDTGLEETCENLILNGLDLSPFGDDILNPDIDIEDYFD